MPIQFPRPTGASRFYIEDQLRKLASKVFYVVPAPSFGNVGTTLSTFRLGDDTSVAVSVRKAVNLRNLGTQYQEVTQRSRPNPASELLRVADRTAGWNRVYGTQNDRIVGVSRDAVGAPLGFCVVKVFRTVDDILVAATASDAGGNWTAYPNQAGPFYFVEYKAGGPDVFGTSPNTNTSTPFTPGQ